MRQRWAVGDADGHRPANDLGPGKARRLKTCNQHGPLGREENERRNQSARTARKDSSSWARFKLLGLSGRGSNQCRNITTLSWAWSLYEAEIGYPGTTAFCLTKGALPGKASDFCPWVSSHFNLVCGSGLGRHPMAVMYVRCGSAELPS